MYRMCCWYIITGNVILCFFFSVAPFAPLLKYTCYMCNRQGAHKSDRISSSLCSHDNALLYLYWYLHFMLIWPWCILSYVWWEAIKLFWILNLESLVPPNDISLSSMEFHGTLRLSFYSMSCYPGLPWDMPWNSVELYRVAKTRVKHCCVDLSSWYGFWFAIICIDMKGIFDLSTEIHPTFLETVPFASKCVNMGYFFIGI